MAKQVHDHGADNQRQSLLGDVAQINTGFTFRSKIALESGGTIRVVQLRSVENNGRINLDEVPFMRLEKKPIGKFLLQKGDVVFGSRGYSTPAALVPDALVGKAIAASPVMIIRVQSNAINPGYLAWFLNHPKGQHQLKKLAEGTSTRMVSKKALTGIKIYVPHTDMQEQIANVTTLQKQEEMLMERRRQLLDIALMKRVQMTCDGEE